MPLDTSSYYPEIPDGEGYSLNRREGGLFGNKGSDKTETSESVSDFGKQQGDNAPMRQSGPGTPETGISKLISGISHFLSWAFVPLLVPVYGVILAFNLTILDIIPSSLKWFYTISIFAIDSIAPFLLIALLKKFGYVSTYGLNGQKERLIPYVLITVAYLGSGYFMAAKGAPIWLTMFFAGGAVAAAINFLINFKWKISAHAASIAGLVALLLHITDDGWGSPLAFPWMIGSMICAGLLGSARVWLGRHTVWQVLAGYAVGFFSVFFMTMIK